MWFPVYDENMEEKKAKTQTRSLKSTKKHGLKRWTNSSAFSRLKGFYVCLYVGLGNGIVLMKEYGYDLEGTDVKLGNKMMLHVAKLNNILLFMTWYHNHTASFKYDKTCEDIMN